MFRDIINACKLLDLIGIKFTRRDPIYHGGQRIYEKLGRALSNEDWRMEFTKA